MKIKHLVFSLLLMGIVDSIDGDIAVVEYEYRGRILHSEVDLTLSPCRPAEGEKVSFFPDYKIVTCEGKSQ